MTSLICLQEELEEVSLDVFSLRPPWEVSVYVQYLL